MFADIINELLVFLLGPCSFVFPFTLTTGFPHCNPINETITEKKMEIEAARGGEELTNNAKEKERERETKKEERRKGGEMR